VQGLPAGAGAETDGRRLEVDGTRKAGRGRRIVGAVASILAVAVLALLAIHVALPQRTGPLVFTEIFEPYIFLAAVPALLLFAALARLRAPTVLLLLVIVAIALRYGPSVVSFPADLPNGAQPLHVMSWNLEAGGVPDDQLATTLDRVRPDIAALIELVPESSRATDQNATIQALYPYRVLLPRSGVPGIGLLSRFPVIESKFTREPPLLRVVVAPSDVDPPITVLVAHPFLQGIDTGGFFPDVETQSRDQAIDLVRAQIDADLAAGHDVLVLGDFNVTEREPAYAELTHGMHDAQREAGVGFGLTWRPERVENLPFGLLRIDYVLASPAFVALSAGPDCTPRGSDHCLVTATFARPRTR
jgi:vancomycin resistance protein VanJ